MDVGLCIQRRIVAVLATDCQSISLSCLAYYRKLLLCIKEDSMKRGAHLLNDCRFTETSASL